MSRAEAIPRHPTPFRSLRALALAFGIALGAGSARADLVLAPSADGYVGAWLAVPLQHETIDSASIQPSSGAPLSDELRWIRWSIVDGGTGAIDLHRAFGGRNAYRALLASVLELPQPFEGMLLLSVDGTVRVTVNGVVRWTRIVPRARGHAWDMVPLSLGAGRHVVSLELEAHGPAWNLEARWLSAANLEPPPNARWRLPGATDGDAERLSARLTRVAATVGLVPSGYQPRIRVEFPRGVPMIPAFALSAEFTKGKASLGDVRLGDFQAGAFDAVERALPAVSTKELEGRASLPTGVTVHVGTGARSLRLTFDSTVPALYARALSLGEALAKGRVTSLDADVARATLENTIVDLGSRLDSGDPSAERVRDGLAAFVSSYEAGRDPLAVPGVLDLARRSSLDGAPDAFELHVPASFRTKGTARYPLLVLLHGYDGTPERIMTAFLGTDSKRPFPGVDGFIVAPAAHGNAFYRGAGEVAVMDTLDWVVAHYPIDPDRISIAGHSMGGTGSAEIAFHHPDRFSAISSLAGYHSYFVRRDVLGQPLRQWEWTELVRFSPASFAENGRDIPLYVAQGTEDKPLAHSEALVDRYQSLGYSVVAEWPEIGHDVWRLVWSGAKGWPPLAARRKPSAPKHVTLKTNSLRLSKRGWVTVVALERTGLPGVVDAKVAAPDRLAVTTSRLAAIALERPAPHVAEAAPVTVTIDGTELAFSAAERLEAHRESNGWVKGPIPPTRGLSKRGGLEGPIRDAFGGPLVFVYGTLDPRQTRATREVAEHFRARYAGNAQFDVVADVALSKSLRNSHSLFLVGSSAANSVTRALDPSLPIGMSKNAVRLGKELVTGDDELGFISVYPNPENPSRYIVVLEAANARGLFRSQSLPLQLPDFLVFDSGVGDAAGQQVLGSARALAAGYYDEAWAIPADTHDVIVLRAAPESARWTPAR